MPFIRGVGVRVALKDQVLWRIRLCFYLCNEGVLKREKEKKNDHHLFIVVLDVSPPGTVIVGFLADD